MKSVAIMQLAAAACGILFDYPIHENSVTPPRRYMAIRLTENALARRYALILLLSPLNALSRLTAPPDDFNFAARLHAYSDFSRCKFPYHFPYQHGFISPTEAEYGWLAL